MLGKFALEKLIVILMKIESPKNQIKTGKKKELILINDRPKSPWL